MPTHTMHVSYWITSQSVSQGFIFVRDIRIFIKNSVQISSILIGMLGVYLLVRRKWSVPKVICAASVLGIIFSP